MGFIEVLLSKLPAQNPAQARHCKLPAISLNDEAHISELDLSTADHRPRVPTEIVRQILEEAVLIERYENFVCEGQFLSISTQCSSCTYRLLALVCQDWRDLVREIFHRQITVSENGHQDEEMLELLRRSPKMASEIRSIDASCRAKHNMLPDLIPASPDSVVEAHERERSVELAREQQRVLQLVALCPNLTTFDADFGYHPDLLKSGALPSTITKLTLRNVTAKDSFALLAHLTNITDLTLRIAPDWILQDLDSTPISPIRLDRLELSATAWGEVCPESLKKLLCNSQTTLRSLAVRNKSSFTAKKFVQVVRELIRHYGSKLEELSVKDIPSRGVRSKDFTPLEWFPSPVSAMPNLRSLHLTGICPELKIFGGLRCSKLRRLLVEDFDNILGQDIPSLIANDLLPSLAFLGVCGIENEEARECIENWCSSRNVKLLAGWKLVEVERRWW